MTGDLYLGKLLGIPFRLHWSWFLAVFLIAWTLAVGHFPRTLPEYRGEAGLYWTLGLLAALGLFLSVLLHELGHAVVAQWFGIPVRGIRLFVFGGVAELGSDPKKPSHEVLVAIGGPVVTLLLILLYVLVLILLLTGSGIHWEWREGLLLQGGNSLSAGLAGLLGYLSLINLAVLVFNMVPAFPLDGGRVLRGLIWAVTGDYLTSTRIAGGLGIAFAWLLYLGGFLNAIQGHILNGLWLFFLGTFLQNAAQSSIAYAQLQQLLRGVRVRDMMCPQPVTVEAHLTLREIVDDFFLRHPYKAYPVVQEGRFLGLLTMRAVQEVERGQWEEVQAGELVANQDPLPLLKPQESVIQAMRKLADTGQSRLPVVEDGQLIGLLCARDVMDYMHIRSGMARPRQDEISSRQSRVNK